MAHSERLVKKIKASRGITGEIVQTTDGRMMFLTTSQLRKATLPRRHHARLSRLAPGGTPPAARRATAGCRAFRRWLLTHDPNTQFWREVYVDWVNNC